VTGSRESNRKQSYDAIVIGAGAGGLAAAGSLAKAGLEVGVLKALGQPGGKMGTMSHEGVEFDTGPSLLTMADTIREVFGAAGAKLEDEVELLELAPAFRYFWPDGASLDIHHDLKRTERSVRSSFGPKAAQEFRDFMRYARKIWEAARPNFIEGDAPSFTSVVKLGVTQMRQITQIDPFRSMIQGIDRHITEPHLRDVMMRYGTYNGSNPLAAPATLNCIAWVEMGLGGWGVRGGMAALPRALARVCERAGVEFHYNSPVDKILTSGNKVTGIELASGERFFAPVVVSNADAAHVREHLLDDSVQHGMTSSLQPSMSSWNGVLKASQNNRRVAHTVLFPEHYEREFVDIFEHNRAPRDPTVYLCAQSLSHGRQGWPEHEPLFVMANAPCEPARGSSDPAEWRELGERTLERVIEHGLISSEDELVWERTPIDLARIFPGSRGAIYGAASNSQFAAFKRPPNRVKQVPGLYLASGSAHPGGGVPLCLSSGRTAATNILDDLGLRGRWRARA